VVTRNASTLRGENIIPPGEPMMTAVSGRKIAEYRPARMPWAM